MGYAHPAAILRVRLTARDRRPRRPHRTRADGATACPGRWISWVHAQQLDGNARARHGEREADGNDRAAKPVLPATLDRSCDRELRALTPLQVLLVLARTAHRYDRAMVFLDLQHRQPGRLRAVRYRPRAKRAATLAGGAATVLVGNAVCNRRRHSSALITSVRRPLPAGGRTRLATADLGARLLAASGRHGCGRDHCSRGGAFRAESAARPEWQSAGGAAWRHGG